VQTFFTDEWLARNEGIVQNFGRDKKLTHVIDQLRFETRCLLVLYEVKRFTHTMLYVV